MPLRYNNCDDKNSSGVSSTTCPQKGMFHGDLDRTECAQMKHEPALETASSLFFHFRSQCAPLPLLSRIACLRSALMSDDLPTLGNPTHTHAAEKQVATPLGQLKDKICQRSRETKKAIQVREKPMLIASTRRKYQCAGNVRRPNE